MYILLRKDLQRGKLWLLVYFHNWSLLTEELSTHRIRVRWAVRSNYFCSDLITRHTSVWRSVLCKYVNKSPNSAFTYDKVCQGLYISYVIVRV
jgi:hypothetical protein